FLALGWYLEEIHVTWAHLEKKQTCTNIHQEVLLTERGDDIAGIKRRRRDLSGDGVWILVTASQPQRVANAIETIAIYEAKTRVARDLMNWVKRQKDKVAENASNKRKWEGKQGGSSSQNKGHKVIRAHIARPSNKKGYARNLPLCNKCKFRHTGPCAAKCGNCKRVGHQTRDCRTSVPERSRGPQWQNRKIKLLVMSVKG
ncbi:reverse transcriptase domain-containing protein, partial [Tanacetum coccineum]